MRTPTTSLTPSSNAITRRIRLTIFLGPFADEQAAALGGQEVSDDREHAADHDRAEAVEPWISGQLGQQDARESRDQAEQGGGSSNRTVTTHGSLLESTAGAGCRAPLSAHSRMAIVHDLASSAKATARTTS